MAGSAPYLSVALTLLEVTGHTRLDLDFTMDAEIVALMGPSGAGKSTLTQCLAGLVPPSGGRVTLEGRCLYDGASQEVVPAHLRRVGLVFQSLALFPHLRTWQNVAYGMVGVPRRERRERARSWLHKVHAGHLEERWPATLSGGEAQRVALARALAAAPRLLLLDEPFSALNETLRVELGERLRALVQELGIGALFVTHDRNDAARVATRILHMDAGRLIGEGLPEAGRARREGGTCPVQEDLAGPSWARSLPRHPRLPA